MISETLEPFFNAGLAGLLWGFVAFLWLLAYVLINENIRLGGDYCTLKDYTFVGLAMMMLCALTFIVLLWTLSIMGV